MRLEYQASILLPTDPLPSLAPSPQVVVESRSETSAPPFALLPFSTLPTPPAPAESGHVLQYRLVEYEKKDGSMGKRVRYETFPCRVNGTVLIKTTVPIKETPIDSN